MLKTKGQISKSQKLLSKGGNLVWFLLRPQTCLFPYRSWRFACTVGRTGNKVNFSTLLIADHPGVEARRLLPGTTNMLCSFPLLALTHIFSFFYNNLMLSWFKPWLHGSLERKPWKIYLTLSKPQFPHL